MPSRLKRALSVCSTYSLLSKPLLSAAFVNSSFVSGKSLNVTVSLPLFGLPTVLGFLFVMPAIQYGTHG
jgi:hypothetical protein